MANKKQCRQCYIKLHTYGVECSTLLRFPAFLCSGAIWTIPVSFGLFFQTNTAEMEPFYLALASLINALIRSPVKIERSAKKEGKFKGQDYVHSHYHMQSSPHSSLDCRSSMWVHLDPPVNLNPYWSDLQPLLLLLLTLLLLPPLGGFYTKGCFR